MKRPFLIDVDFESVAFATSKSNALAKAKRLHKEDDTKTVEVWHCNDGLIWSSETADA